MPKTPAWTRNEGKSKSGGLNAKGRASYNAETGGELKAPVKSGDNPRRARVFHLMLIRVNYPNHLLIWAKAIL